MNDKNRPEDRIYQLEREVSLLKEERLDLRNRLGKLLCDKLTADNPAIADLSDKNRPTKLGEMYRELYDNQWTDAYDVLQKSFPDDTTQVLCNTLLMCYQFCEKKASMLLKRCEGAVDDLFKEPGPGVNETFMNTSGSSISVSRDDLDGSPAKIALGNAGPLIKGDLTTSVPLAKVHTQWRPKNSKSVMQTVVTKPNLDTEMKKMRKEIAELLIPVVQKAYLDKYWDANCFKEMKPFIKECVYISWMMTVQTPPMCFRDLDQTGSQFDHNVYNLYTTRGQHINFIVWPAMLLHKDGPVVCKGTAAAMTTPKPMSPMTTAQSMPAVTTGTTVASMTAVTTMVPMTPMTTVTAKTMRPTTNTTSTRAPTFGNGKTMIVPAMPNKSTLHHEQMENLDKPGIDTSTQRPWSQQPKK